MFTNKEADHRKQRCFLQVLRCTTSAAHCFNIVTFSITSLPFYREINPPLHLLFWVYIMLLPQII